MLKQKQIKDTKHLSNFNDFAVQAGALGFAALMLVGATEMIMEHMPSMHQASGHGSTSISELFARGEGKGETARMPEEFDIGLQTPHITGV